MYLYICIYLCVWVWACMPVCLLCAYMIVYSCACVWVWCMCMWTWTFTCLGVCVYLFLIRCSYACLMRINSLVCFVVLFSYSLFADKWITYSWCGYFRPLVNVSFLLLFLSLIKTFVEAVISWCVCLSWWLRCVHISIFSTTAVITTLNAFLITYLAFKTTR